MDPDAGRAGSRSKRWRIPADRTLASLESFAVRAVRRARPATRHRPGSFALSWTALDSGLRIATLTLRRVLSPWVWISALAITGIVFFGGQVESDPFAIEQVTGFDARLQELDRAARSFRVALGWIAVLVAAQIAQVLGSACLLYTSPSPRD